MDFLAHTVVEKLEILWSMYPEKDAFIFRGDDDAQRRVLTNSAVQRLAKGCANYLEHQGVEKGDVVCNMLAVSLERLVVNFGILLAGGVVMHGEVIDGRRGEREEGGGDIRDRDKGDSRFWQPLKQAKVKFIVLSPQEQQRHSAGAWRILKEHVTEPEGGCEDEEGGDGVAMMINTYNAPSLQKVFRFNLHHRVEKQGESHLQVRYVKDSSVLLPKDSSVQSLNKVVKISSHQRLMQSQSSTQNLYKSDRDRSALDIFRTRSLRQGNSEVTEVRGFDACCIMVKWDDKDNRYQLVMWDHMSVVKLGHRLEHMLGATPSDVLYDDRPLSWIPGLPFLYITLGCTTVRSTLMECPERRVIRHVWQLLDEEQVTMAALTVPVVQMMTSHCQDVPEPRHRLRVLTTDGHGQACRSSILDAIGVITQSLVPCYCRMEAGLIARLVLDEGNKHTYIEGCVGEMYAANRHDMKRDDYNEARISQTSLVEPLQVGDIFLEGPTVFKGYYNDPDLTKISFTKEGSFITGDVGFYNEAGQLFVLGRKSEAIMRGGQCNKTPIFRRHIEELFRPCHGVWKVKVVTIKDRDEAVKVVACVVPRRSDPDTKEKIRLYMRHELGTASPHDADSHMPNYVVFFESFPTSEGHVVSRKLLAFMATQILQLEEEEEMGGKQDD